MENNNTKPFYNTEIPGDWDVKSLGEVATFINGKAYTQEELLSEGKYKVLRVGNFFTKGEWYFSDLELEEDKYVSDGDLMYAWSASFGPQFWNGEKTIYHYHIWKVIPAEIITKQFLFFLLDYDTQRILSSKQGGTMFHITKGDMEKRKTNIPLIPEQKAIAKVLSTADAAIHTTEKLIAQKELRKKWLMQQLLTGKKRLLGFGGEWKEVRLKDVTTNFSRRNKDLVDAKVYSVTNKSGFVLQSDHFEGKVAGEDLSNYKIIKKNEFAYNPARVNVGSLAYFEEEIGVISSLYVCFKTTKDMLDYFLLQFLQIDHTKHRIEALGEGGVRVYLWYDLFSKIKIRIPSIEEQTAIAQVLQAADKEISLLKAKAEKLRELKKGLMQLLLTGKVRLKIENN